MPRSTLKKIVIVYDEDCGFCKRCIHYLDVKSIETHTADLWESLPDSQAKKNLSKLIPELSCDAFNFKASVHMFMPNGDVKVGAEAVFEALAITKVSTKWRTLYRKLPGFSWITEHGYRWVANHRRFVSQCTNWLFGSDHRPSNGAVCDGLSAGSNKTFSFLFRGLGLIYIMAFASLGVQVLGLFGESGILPIAEYADYATKHGWGGRFPSLFFWMNSNFVLQVSTMIGAFFGALLFLGRLPAISAFVCWFLCASFVATGQVFLSFQWDVLLLECGFLAVLGLPLISIHQTKPHVMVKWLMKFLLFRLMLTAGLVKLVSNDPLWANFSALDVHFWTQPLPHIGGWIADGLWGPLKKVGVGMVLFIELVMPWFIWLPRRPRLIAFFSINALMLIILFTGNYGFFNVLVMVMTLSLLDDDYLRKIEDKCPRLIPELTPWRKFKISHRGSKTERKEAIRSKSVNKVGARLKQVKGWGIMGFGCCLVIAILNTEYSRFIGPSFQSIKPLEQTFQRYHLYSTYGLFAVMTTARDELVFYGSSDGKVWKPYTFKWKPQTKQDKPKWVQPHQPRLEWQLWFASLTGVERQPWIYKTAIRLLQGSDHVEKLFENNPFEEQPPTYIQVVRTPFKFSTMKELKESGDWWETGKSQAYTPVLYLSEGR